MFVVTHERITDWNSRVSKLLVAKRRTEVVKACVIVSTILQVLKEWPVREFDLQNDWSRRLALPLFKIELVCRDWHRLRRERKRRKQAFSRAFVHLSSPTIGGSKRKAGTSLYQHCRSG